MADFETQLNRDLKLIEDDFTKLIKEEIRRQGLVDTGKLLNSIRFFIVKTNRGYKFNMEAMDYFTYLNKKYNIVNNVMRSRSYERIQDRIADIVANSIVNDITVTKRG